MEPVIDLKCSLPAAYTSLSPTALIWQDVLAQAMTGELHGRDELHLFVGDM